MCSECCDRPVVARARARGLDVLLWWLPPTVVGLGPARVAAMRLALEQLGAPILVMDDDVERPDQQLQSVDESKPRQRPRARELPM